LPFGDPPFGDSPLDELLPALPFLPLELGLEVGDCKTPGLRFPAEGLLKATLGR